MCGCIIHTLRTEGPQALYKGLHAPVVSSGISTGLTFYSKALWTKFLKKQMGYRESDRGSLAMLGLSGALTGLSIAPVVIPTDVVKVRCQGSVVPQGTIECAINIIRKEGLKGLATGGIAGVLQLGTQWGIIFAGYEYIMDIMSVEGERPGSLGTLVAGSTSGVASWILAMPLDITKTKQQMNPESNTTFVRTVRATMQTQGMKGFYKGFNAVAARAMVSNASFFWFYEQISKLFKRQP